MTYWLRYIWHRLCNEFRQLACLPLKEENVVGEVMGKLKLDPELRKIIEEHEESSDNGNA